MDDEARREALTAVVANAQRQLWARRRDLKNWETMLARAESPKGLRASQRLASSAASAKAEIQKAIAQALFDIERFEIELESAEEELAGIPEEAAA